MIHMSQTDRSMFDINVLREGWSDHVQLKVNRRLYQKSYQKQTKQHEPSELTSRLKMWADPRHETSQWARELDFPSVANSSFALTVRVCCQRSLDHQRESLWTGHTTSAIPCYFLSVFYFCLAYHPPNPVRGALRVSHVLPPTSLFGQNIDWTVQWKSGAISWRQPNIGWSGVRDNRRPLPSIDERDLFLGNSVIEWFCFCLLAVGGSFRTKCDFGVRDACCLSMDGLAVVCLTQSFQES